MDAPGAAVIGLGELLWDCFPDRRLPGGAPANVAFHVQQLGLSATVATRVGTDALGDELCTFLQAQGLTTDLVQRDPLHRTGTVTVECLPTGNRFTFLEESAWDYLEATPAWLSAMAAARAICFGTLAQRHAVSRETIMRCVRHAQEKCLVVYDVNLRPPFYAREWIDQSLRLASLAKLNDAEAALLAALLQGPEGNDLVFARWLREHYGLEAVCVTRGERGAACVSTDGDYEIPGISVHVADTVGAGDAFSAALIWARLSKWPWDRALLLANAVGALVASRPGAMPLLRDEYQALKEQLGQG